MAYSTQQKNAIQKVLAESQEPLTPVEILAAAKSQVAGMGIATVYRYLNTLNKEGKVAIVEIPQSSPRYVLSKDRCPVYFLCSKCSRVFPLKDELHELKTLSLSKFDVKSYQVFLFGTCKAGCTS